MKTKLIASFVAGASVGILVGGGAVLLAIAVYPSVPVPMPVGHEVPPSEHLFMLAAASISSAVLLGLVTLDPLLDEEGAA